MLDAIVTEPACIELSKIAIKIADTYLSRMIDKGVIIKLIRMFFGNAKA